jgi:hypothetical protein
MDALVWFMSILVVYNFYRLSGEYITNPIEKIHSDLNMFFKVFIFVWVVATFITTISFGFEDAIIGVVITGISTFIMYQILGLIDNLSAT